MLQFEPGLKPRLAWLAGVIFFVATGALGLFRAKALQDWALGYFEGRRGWFWAFHRKLMRGPLPVVNARVVGVVSLLVGLAMLWLGVQAVGANN